ncbi:MAG: ferrous iron transporter B, partial [Thermoplasmatales archaeon]|nr:ferrous iron transporter B [Candidatus Thermoplasmatota archaeon]MCG2825666.1 ferrous iron transporter B [Thermoplasmatales archaeon]
MGFKHKKNEKKELKKILLMGNPNVGKSVFFSRLTGANVICSNYPGTTIDFTKGVMRIKGERAEVIDVPGTCSLEPTNKAEEVAVKMVGEGDVIINVVDATNLERNLYLTFELLEQNVPVIVALNMWDDTKHKGITIDVKHLEKILGVPVIPTVAVTGEGIRTLVSRLDEAKSPDIKPTSEEGRWIEIGDVVKKVQKVKHRHHTISERISDATVKPVTGIPVAVIVLFLAFQFIITVGNLVIEKILDPFFCNYYGPWITDVVNSFAPSGLLHDLLVGQFVEGKLDFAQSFGLLTTGLYVPFVMVLPFVTLFYLMLSLLEDVGYLPRLSVLVDTIFHRVGLHGFAIVSVMLGLGCNVPGALSTRILETRKQRFISAALLAICVPCMAQTAMIFGILGRYGAGYIMIVFSTLVILYVLLGFIMNKFIKGEAPEIFMEIPPYRKPSLTTLMKKTWMRVRWFLVEAVPFVIIGVFIVNLMYLSGAIDILGNIFAPVLVGWLGLPKEAAGALIIGFLRKDV